jgi:hypothetical protein
VILVIKYHISPSSNPNDFVVKVWEAESDGPGGEVYTSPNIPAPHVAPYTLTINGLDKVVHIVRMYDVVTEELIHEYNAESKTDLVTIFTPIFFKIGDGGPNTPLSGTSVYTNSVLEGLGANDYYVIRNGQGVMFDGIHIDYDSVGGSWSLHQTGDVFGYDEEFVIIRQPNAITTAVNDSVVGKLFGGFVDISASRDYLATDLRKLLRFTGTCTYTFGAAQTIPIGYIFAFTHFGTANGIGTVQFLNAPLKWGNTTVTTFEVKRFCTAAFIYDGTQWNVLWVGSAADAVASSTPGTILGANNYSVGDVPGSNPSYIVTHGLNVVGDYLVQLSIKTKVGSEPLFHRNNTITSTWWHSTSDKPNKFHFSLEQLTNEIQSVDVSWVIIQL